MFSKGGHVDAENCSFYKGVANATGTHEVSAAKGGAFMLTLAGQRCILTNCFVHTSCADVGGGICLLLPMSSAQSHLLRLVEESVERRVI